MRLKSTVLTCAFLFATTSVGAEPLTPGDFATMAIVANMYEVEAAKLAQTKAQNSDTKQFATSMLRDHGDAVPELSKAAEEEGVRIPDALTTEYQQKIDALKEASTSEFDQAYLSSQVAVHEEAVALFTTYVDSGRDGALKNLASKLLPTLHTHEVRIHGLTAK